MKYNELKDKLSQELNDFKGVFYTFGSDQFAEGMAKIGLTTKDTDKIYSIGYGGYILKTKVDEYRDMFKRHNEAMDEAMKDKVFLIDAMDYELGNHEWAVTMDTTDALKALGLDRDNLTEMQQKCLNEAVNMQREWAMGNCW